MNLVKEICALAAELKQLAASEVFKRSVPSIDKLTKVAGCTQRAFSGSCIGYHANVYYEEFQAPPPGMYFSREYGIDQLPSGTGTRGKWKLYDPHFVLARIKSSAGNPDFTEVVNEEKEVAGKFLEIKSDLDSIITLVLGNGVDPHISQLYNELMLLTPKSTIEVAQALRSKGGLPKSRDRAAIAQGLLTPPHIQAVAEVISIRLTYDNCRHASAIANRIASHLERKEKFSVVHSPNGTKVFIGHGHSLLWLELKNFIQERLKLVVDEFNRVSVAGVHNQTRLQNMLDNAAIGFAVLTAEDETKDGNFQARMNVIHEVGLLQGRLGFAKGIVMMENGCEEFSNIEGTGQIRFDKGKIKTCFEEVRRVLERENLIKP